jgi:hypothetical protein
MPRTRTFRRVHLHELDEHEAAGWAPASNRYTLYDAGRVPVVLVERTKDTDFADAIAASMEHK